MSESTRSLAGKIAANTRWASEPDRSAATAPARSAFLAGFEKQVDPDGQLPPEERARRAESLRKAHMQRMAAASAKARRRYSAERRLREVSAELATLQQPGGDAA